MEYVNLGRTGVKVSKLCLGTMMFGRSTSESDSMPIIEHALEQGINFIDTANIYAVGQSETIVGKVLSKSKKRDQIVLASKVFFHMDKADPNAGGISRRHIIRACEDSLKRLQTDWIDLYQMHRPQADIPIDESLRAMDDLIRSGKVRYIGSSMFPGWRMIESLWVAKELGLNRIVCEQAAYHLLDRTAEREVIPAAQSYGLGVISWGPLCGGLLSGKYKRDDMTAAGRWQGGTDNLGRQATPRAFDVIEVLARIAARKSCTPSQLALAWNAAQPGITSPIIGPRLLEQLQDNLGAVDVTLDAEDIAELDAVAPPLSVSLRYYDAANGLDLRPNIHQV